MLYVLQFSYDMIYAYTRATLLLLLTFHCNASKGNRTIKRSKVNIQYYLHLKTMPDV